jgi:(4S)-4-hydroxy-5-phosphonooxypentane-2,3-dione isomerase
MFIVHVHVLVKPNRLSDFITATMENAQNSILEPGVVRFDFLQEADHPEKFLLVEIYRTQDDTVKHKETAHYRKWRDQVMDMMAEPRKGVPYHNLFPGDGKLK